MRERLEANAEELVDLLLQAARAGEWRVVGMMWDRVFGRPKETVAVERQGEENQLAAELRLVPPEERRAWLRDLNSRAEAAEEAAEN